MKRIVLAISIALLIIASGISVSAASNQTLQQSPVPIEQWNRTFGGASHDNCHEVQQTSEGGYIITGETKSYGAGGGDAWLIKTDKDGNEEWNKTFGGADRDRGESVQQTSDGGYIITGTTWSYGAGGGDVWLIKTDKNGTEELNKTFGDAYDEHGKSVQQTSDGGYIITGDTYSYGLGGDDVLLIKTDKNGNEEWKKIFGRFPYAYGYNDGGESVQQTSDGGYIITGFTMSYGAGELDIWLIKTNKNGNVEWGKTFGGTSVERGESVQQTSDGGYIITGGTNSYGAAAKDVWLIKTDKNGTEEWNRTFGGAGGADFADGESVQQTSDGGYIITGTIYTYGTGCESVWLIKTDKNGNEEWTKTFGGTAVDRGTSVQQTSDGGYIITGTTWSYGAGRGDFWLIKLAPSENISLSLGDAVDNTALSWNTGGNASWFGQRSTHFYGGDAAQSGMISHNQESWIQTTVSGPGTLRYYWNVSSEANKDFLEFYSDDIIQDRISGSVDWHQKSYNLSSGSHTLKWRYMKDGSVNSSSDCGWLDNVEFAVGSVPTPTTTPTSIPTLPPPTLPPTPTPTPTSTTTAPLPSPVVIPIGSWENPQVEIENQAHLSITVTITGPSSVTIYLSPGETKTKQLSPGEYTIYATATGVIPYSGSITLSKGYKYIWQFYISQVP